MNNNIYLDYASTTPLSKQAFNAMLPYLQDKFGNPSSVHTPGQFAQAGLDNARASVARILECDHREIIFTSGATESIALALFGVIHNSKQPHIITTTLEHSAVLNSARHLEKQGVEVSYISPTKHGIIQVQDVAQVLKPNTALVSVMLANNEIGTFQPIRDIATAVKNKNKDVVIHSDITQAVNYVDIRPKELGVDMLSFSSHKIYGPKGVGCLYKKQSVEITPMLFGGEQEHNLRAGTENIASIVGFAVALEQAQKNKQWYNEANKVKTLRDALLEQLLKEPRISLNGSLENRLPNNINITLQGIPAQTALPYLDSRGVYVSSASACTSHTLKPSYVVEAIGKKEQARNTIRISLGRHTTEQDIQTTAHIIRTLTRTPN